MFSPYSSGFKSSPPIIKSIPIYNGKIVNLKRNLVELPNETLAFREIVKHQQGVCIIPVIGDEIIFVKQYRSGAEKVLLELPAGIVDKNESPLDAAIRELKEEYPDRTIYTIDTKGITICSYNIVKEIGDLYLQGKSIEEIIKWSEVEVDKFATYFYADTLDFFKLSGRVTNFSAIMGTLFGVHPVITMNSEGKMVSVNKCKGKTKSLNKLVDYVCELGEDVEKHRVIIGHSDALDLAKKLGELLEERLGKKLPIEYVVVNPTAGSHCGPDTIGVCFHAKHR